MKSIISKSAVLASACLLLGGGVAGAATRDVMQINVPFAFEVEGRTLPAGRYTVEEDNGGALLIRGAGANRAAAFIATERAAGSDPADLDPVVTFARGERMHRLDGIWASREEGWTVANR